MKITNKDIVKYCEYENKMQTNVYSKKIASGKMDKDIARRNYIIIRDLGRLAALLERKGMSMQDLTAMLDGLDDKKQYKQGEVQFPN